MHTQFKLIPLAILVPIFPWISMGAHFQLTQQPMHSELEQKKSIEQAIGGTVTG